MKQMKRLVFLAVVAGLGCGALWLWESPYFAMVQIEKGFDEHDAVRVETYVDLEAFVRSGVDVMAALAKEQIGVNGNDLGSRVLGGLLGAVTDKIGDAAAIAGAVEVRRAIQQGRLALSVGPFVVDDGVKAFGGMQRFQSSAIVDVNGSCNGKPAVLRVIFEERNAKDGSGLLGLLGVLGHPKRFVVVGVDKESLPALARACR